MGNLSSARLRRDIRNTVRAIEPFDDVEQVHKQDVLAWLASTAPLFRIGKPADPPKHLVAYFVPYDTRSQRLLLIDHKLARLWLPPGGHVEIDEDPRLTVARESYEELGISAAFTPGFGDKPFFITVTETRGVGSHTDVSLWYIVSGNSNVSVTYDEREINGYRWLRMEDVLATDSGELDPHMHRFAQKLRRSLGEL